MTEQELNALMGLLIDKHYFTYQDLDKIYDLKGTKARRVHRFINIVSQGLNNNVALSNVNAITLSEIGGLDLEIIKELRNFDVTLTASPLTSIDSVWEYVQKNSEGAVRLFIKKYFYLKATNGLKKWNLENAQLYIKDRSSYFFDDSEPHFCADSEILGAWIGMADEDLDKISYHAVEKAMYKLARLTFQNAMEMPEEKRKILLNALERIYYELSVCYLTDPIFDDIPEDDYYEQLARDAHLLDLNKMNAADFKEKGYKTKGSNFEGYLKENSSKKPRKIDRETIRKAKGQLVENEFDEEFTYEPTEVTRVSLQELKDLKLLKRGLITPEYFARMHNMPTSIIEKLSNLQSIKELAREYAICKMDVAFKLAQTSSIGNSEDETIDIKSSPLDSQKDKKLGYHNVPRRVRLLEHNKKLHHKKTEVEKIQFEF